ncbi:MAG: ATP synthase F0 subunit B [Thermodesulfobacteriota bacterium]
MIVIDGSVIIQIINFVFLIWVLNTVLYKPIRKVLRQRHEKVAGLENSIETCTRDSREKDASFELGVKDARKRGLKEKDALLQAAAEEEKKIIAKINEKAQAEIVAIREKIAKDAERVRETLQKEIEVFAEEIERKILGRSAS